ncbi:AMP-binding protein [Mycolicibacterium neoaurum]|nr:AMP-binding protein [Mycolicibacterium neoaurum]
MFPSKPHPTASPAQILPYAASRFPDKVGLVIGDVRLTYRELDRLSTRVGAALIAQGIRAGDIVSLYGQNSWQWIVSYHGVLKAGAVANPVNVMLTGPELTYVLNDCNAQAVLAGADKMPTVAAIFDDLTSVRMACSFGAPGTARKELLSWDDLVTSVDSDVTLPYPQPEPRSLCSIGYTSGTTGHPKGAMHAHQSVLLNCALTATMHGRADDEIIVTALPGAHVYGNVAINGTFLAGGTVVLMERFDPGQALQLIERERATMFEGVPAMYSMILADKAFSTADLKSLRKSTIGGQTFSPSIAERWQEKATGPLLELWGMTEVAGLGTTHALHAPPVPGSIGVALPGFEAKIAPIDGSTAEVPQGTRGELMVRGPLVMLGYHNRPEATAEVLGADGWLRTGDVAYVNETGHFFVVDRLKDMILTAGYNVYPAEIERVICAHENVTMAAVGKRPDDVKGEVAIAYVVVKSGSTLDAAELIEFCRANLAAYKCPRDIVFVDALPMTSSGKLMRRKLAETAPSPKPSAIQSA